jgi:hypothetical protein
MTGFSLFIGQKAFPAYSGLEYPIVSIGLNTSLVDIEDYLYSQTLHGVRIEDISLYHTKVHPWLHRVLDVLPFQVAMYASYDNIPSSLLSRCSYVVKACDYVREESPCSASLFPVYMSSHKFKRQIMSCYHE